MLIIDPDKTPPLDMYQFLIGSVAPRPIAFVSTVDTEGVANLAPYSFFNAFSANPPIVVFSSSLRGGNAAKKDTLRNVENTKECVINMVSHNIVRQMTLTAHDYPSDVNEFQKAGLTPLASDLVKPFRVAESPVQMECKVEQIISLGELPTSGRLIVCRVVRMHINEAVLTDDKRRIDPNRMDLVGRLNRYWYTRASGASLFEIERSDSILPIGFDGLPKSIRTSNVLTGNHLAEIAALTALPSNEAILSIKKDVRVQKTLFSQDKKQGLHLLAQEAFLKGDVDFGVKAALLVDFV
jgi:flavin reductase (DIM6/NTAB) family NADH-FMN oxidoreductase RutF